MMPDLEPIDPPEPDPEWDFGRPVEEAAPPTTEERMQNAEEGAEATE